MLFMAFIWLEKCWNLLTNRAWISSAGQCDNFFGLMEMSLLIDLTLYSVPSFVLWTKFTDTSTLLDVVPDSDDTKISLLVYQSYQFLSKLLNNVIPYKWVIKLLL